MYCKPTSMSKVGGFDPIEVEYENLNIKSLFGTSPLSR